jgi:hypothetical protein
VGWVGGATVAVLVLAMAGTGYGFIKMAGVRWDES